MVQSGVSLDLFGTNIVGFKVFVMANVVELSSNEDFGADVSLDAYDRIFIDSLR
ncbi:hypothetical protein RchiOBHm_Chr3g0487221 [Rosa chinensis]|uniref:Uncharacterized protein n=1 Tax=Rosa chinensis TaxID=74649 RepID=A0A2P6RFH6_ROSCH|nr:hypothetical protein RchiOBHm_Chr3g0487221 [Rosa chinensis]